MVKLAYIGDFGINGVVGRGVGQHGVEGLEEVVHGQGRRPLAKQVLAGLSGGVYIGS